MTLNFQKNFWVVGVLNQKRTQNTICSPQRSERRRTELVCLLSFQSDLELLKVLSLHIETSFSLRNIAWLVTL